MMIGDAKSDLEDKSRDYKNSLPATSNYQGLTSQFRRKLLREWAIRIQDRLIALYIKAGDTDMTVEDAASLISNTIYSLASKGQFREGDDAWNRAVKSHQFNEQMVLDRVAPRTLSKLEIGIWEHSPNHGDTPPDQDPEEDSHKSLIPANCHHNEDFSEVVWKGNLFILRGKRSKAIKTLWERHEQGHESMLWRTIQKEGIATDKPYTYFRGIPNWGSLIYLHGDGRVSLQLDRFTT
jgi:hypothetical protein